MSSTRKIMWYSKIYRRFYSNLKSIALSLFFIIISIILLYFAYKPGLRNTFGSYILSNVSLTIFVSSSIGVLFNLITKTEITEDVHTVISDELDKNTRFKKLGLEEVYKSSKDYDFRDFISNSKNLTVVMNDSKAWKSTYHAAIKYRLKKSDFRTKFLLLDLDNSELNKVMSRKTRHEDDIDYLRSKIIAVEKSLYSMNKNSNHYLEIKKHDLINTYSVFMNDDTAILTPYRLSRGKEDVPLYIYKKPINSNCEHFQDCDECMLLYPDKINEFCRVKRDIEELEEYIDGPMKKNSNPQKSNSLLVSSLELR
ncbi:MAG: hypothetical protein ACPKQO_01530 [Nitrososphaeraceae archaeon]